MQDRDNPDHEVRGARGLPPAGITPDLARSMIGDLPISMVITDPNRADGPIIYVNRAFEEVTGYSARFAVGRNCRFLQGADRDQPGLSALREAVRDGASCVTALRNYRADGEMFTNRLMISPLRDEAGTLLAFVGMQCEIEEAGSRIEADEVTTMLRDAQARVADPLALVTAMVDLQARTENAFEAYRALASRVEGLALLYDEFSHSAAPRHGDRAVVSGGGYVSRVASMLSSLEGSAAIRVNVDADAIPMRTDDASKLGVIASEALSNTFRHAFANRSDGLVEVRLKRLGADRLRLVVADDGIGLGDARWPDGDGAGARIVRSFAAQLGGALDVSSGRFGTTVTLDLNYHLPTAVDEDGLPRMAAAETSRR